MKGTAMLTKNQAYHFIGIGGIGVSAIARVLHQKGVRLQGSDVRESQLTTAIRDLGIDVTIGHDASNLGDADVVVYSTAVPTHNVERRAAQDRGIPLAHRSDLLGLCIADHESIGVTGTHGKGTVSAMITHVLKTMKTDPTFIIGGILNNYGTNALAGAGKFAIAEVDESDKSHLNLRPNHVVVNNLEVDHLNFYADHGEIVSMMGTFLNQNDALQTVALNAGDAGCRQLSKIAEGKRILTFAADGVSKADYTATDILDEGADVSFTAHCQGEILGRVTLGVPGNYNADNALAAMTILHGALDVPFEQIASALNTYQGLENRFTVRHAAGITIVKDYISHPTGMRRVLESARKMPHGTIWCVFKPYRFTLMHYHGPEYAEAFRGADEVVITKMYAAEEKPIDGIDTPWFCDVLTKAGNRVHYVPDNDDVIGYLDPKIAKGDMVIFFGGDDFFQMADAWCESRLK
jgi:UDP-N-acetylmuramate--alanine ligase